MGAETGVDQGGRRLGELAGVKATEFAFGRKGHHFIEAEFALGRQARLAAADLQPGQAEALAAQAGFGQHGEAAIFQIEFDRLLLRTQRRGNWPIQAG